MVAAEAAVEALIDQACRDVLPRAYPLPADPFYAAVVKLVILRGGLAKLEHVKARIKALGRREGGNGVLVRVGVVKAAFPLARHNRIQVRVADELKKAGKFVRKASVRDLRRDRYDRSQSQADIVVENMTPDGVPVLVDFGVTHSLLLSYARAAAQRGELDAEGASERAHAANI